MRLFQGKLLQVESWMLAGVNCWWLGSGRCGERLVWLTDSVCKLEAAPFQHHWSIGLGEREKGDGKEEGRQGQKEGGRNPAKAEV